MKKRGNKTCVRGRWRLEERRGDTKQSKAHSYLHMGTHPLVKLSNGTLYFIHTPYTGAFSILGRRFAASGDSEEHQACPPCVAYVKACVCIIGLCTFVCAAYAASAAESFPKRRRLFSTDEFTPRHGLRARVQNHAAAFVRSMPC